MDDRQPSLRAYRARQTIPSSGFPEQDVLTSDVMVRTEYK
jgi:hypothetical protein